jgi:pimeloyl-ACP methyl ester carboxylesterase
MLLESLTVLATVAAAGWTATGLVGAHAEQRHPPSGRFVALPGGRLHLVDSGEPFAGAPVIVLIHGASSLHADLLATLGPHLLGKARVIAFDRPGHGWSERLGGRDMADPARQADALVAALAAIGVTRVTLVAHSLAGAVATRMALDRPDLVHGVVLLGAVTHPWPGAAITWYYHPGATPGIGALFSRLIAIPAGSLMLKRSIAGVFAPQAAPPDYVETAGIKLVLRPSTFEANAQDVKVIYDFVSAQHPRYRELAMPVLAIAGEADTVVWTDIHSRAIAREAKDGRLITLPGVGHMPHHAVPELIAHEALAIAAA